MTVISYLSILKVSAIATLLLIGLPHRAYADNSSDVKAMESLGKKAYFRCRACHSLAEGEAHKVGPNLYGLIGRKAGSVESFNYSEALKESGVIWSKETLKLWLENPAKFVPNNQMAYGGTKNAKELEALLMHLETNTR